ncbi:unnamed protein product, partial [Mesorhabditis belari]|uniref:Uncharacterized protein n=1 Tax=Mesorhabditis belari TaxID=2138241 RepID=A0AAF3F8K8_9BILA
MGLASSRHRRASDGGSASSRKLKERPSTDVTNVDRDFSKSQSMPMLDRERKGTITPANGITKPGKVGGTSVRRSESAIKRNDSLAPKTRPPLRRQSTSNKMQSNGYPRQKSIRRDISHPIAASGREIIVQCFDNPHSEFGNKSTS